MTTNELHLKGDNGIFSKVLRAKMLNAEFILCPYAVARLKFVRPSIAQTPMYYAKGVQKFQAPFSFLNTDWGIQCNWRTLPIPSPSSSKIMGFTSTASQAIPKAS
jgi:hypothetical protein